MDAPQTAKHEREEEYQEEGESANKRQAVSLIEEAEQEEPLQDLQPEEATSSNKSNQTEMFRVVIDNIPKYCQPSQLRGLLQKLGVPTSKIKKGPNWTYAFASYESEDARVKAIEVIRKSTYKHKQLNASPAQAATRQLPTAAQNASIKPDVPISEQINDRVTPLWRIPYENQLTQKRADLISILSDHRAQLRECIPYDLIKQPPYTWIPKTGPLVSLNEMIASPLINGYRNKCEFAFGRGVDGQPTLGFMLGTFTDGVTVAEPFECLNVCGLAKDVVRVFQEFVRTKAHLPVYDRIEQEGFWRLLLVRTTESGQVLVVVQVHPQTYSAEEKQREKDNLLQFIKDKQLVLHKLLWQEEKSSSTTLTTTTPQQLLGEDGIIIEELMGLKFRISPFSFFQVNTRAAEVLYKTVGERCMLNAETTVLDLCCGTGTIGLTVAHRVKHVIGIEIIPEAIADAKLNAEINGVKNVTYKAAKIERVIDDVTRGLTGHVVAILDPPRSGVVNDVIKTLRKTSAISDIVYVACDAKRVQQNFIDLCRVPSNSLRGDAFEAISAISVDLFPHTEHCELVVHFRRVKEETLPKEQLTQSDIKQEL